MTKWDEDIDWSVFAYVGNANHAPAATPDMVVYFEQGDAAAVYVDGDLVMANHPPEVQEKVFSLLGITTVQDGCFLLGQSSWSGVAATVADAANAAADREDRAAKASELRAKADELLRQANELDSPS